MTTVTTTDEGTETTTDTLDYTYGVNGPASVNWNETEYYYLTNAQGDIVALLDESGNFVIQYSYDAWGNPLSTTGSMADTLGSRNSLRYRGYVFDDETGLYYLQSRYYDPEICRFINADSFTTTGQGLLGNNMLIYCGNNPVSRMDPIGKSWLSNKWNSMCNFFEDVYEYVSNSDEETARKNLKKDGFTFYKSVPVFSISRLGYGAFSFGIIGMGSANLDDPDFDMTLNHEYGHRKHFDMIGPVDYFFTTAIPSLIYADMTNNGEFPRERYYDLPWERTADYLGGVERGYLPATNTVASLFWLFTLSFSSGTPF